MKKTKNEMREWWGRVVRVLVVGVMLFSAGVQAGYRSVDISDIQGEQRKALGDLWADLKKMPPEARDGFICEQLGLMFSKDYSRVLSTMDGHPATTNTKNAYFVGREGEPLHWWEATNAAHEGWSKCYDAAKQFKVGASLVPFKKEVRKVTRNTAKYLLKNMPEEHRWLILAFMGDMVYNYQGPYDRGRGAWVMESGIGYEAPWQDISGYFFLDPEGKECDVRKVFFTHDNDRRWRQMVWRCENLVGAKDILALFPEEVKAMRAHYRERIVKVKDEAKAKSDALLVAADEGMSSLTKSQRLSRIAKAVGLYYSHHSNGGYNPNYHWLNPDVTILLPDGKRCTLKEVMDEKPGLLQQVPHDAILEFYRQPIEQMARNIAGVRFKEMPPLLRDMLRAQLSRKLIKLDGSSAETEKNTCAVQTFDRSWQVPVNVPRDIEHTYFRSSAGQILPFSLYKTYERDYSHTISVVHLCARIFGKTEAVKLIPPGNGTALTAEQQRAWLAEKMGFCFTEDGGAAYQSERTANGNAVYVDAQGKVRKLSEVPGKDSAGWTEATSIALAVGYDKFTAPYREELKQLAVQTSKHILESMPPELRQSRLAEDNMLLFMPNVQVSYNLGEDTLESGIKYSHQGVGLDPYRKCMYYDPNGKIVPTTDPSGGEWGKRWSLLSHCETVAGIDAINALFPAEVESMRAAFQKSPFYKK